MRGHGVLLVCTVYSVLHSKIALSRKPFGIGHMYIYTLLLKITDTMTPQNIDRLSWDILYIGDPLRILRSQRQESLASLRISVC
jgi:hypothetical protein